MAEATDDISPPCCHRSPAGKCFICAVPGNLAKEMSDCFAYALESVELEEKPSLPVAVSQGQRGPVLRLATFGTPREVPANANHRVTAGLLPTPLLEATESVETVLGFEQEPHSVSEGTGVGDHSPTEPQVHETVVRENDGVGDTGGTGSGYNDRHRASNGWDTGSCSGCSGHVDEEESIPPGEENGGTIQASDTAEQCPSPDLSITTVQTDLTWDSDSVTARSNSLPDSSEATEESSPPPRNCMKHVRKWPLVCALILCFISAGLIASCVYLGEYSLAHTI